MKDKREEKIEMIVESAYSAGYSDGEGGYAYDAVNYKEETVELKELIQSQIQQREEFWKQKYKEGKDV